MSLPHKKNDRASGRKASIAARGVIVPQIYVRTGTNSYMGGIYAQAHIRTRGGRYRYLVWREGERTREFYLGKVANSCPTADVSWRARRKAPAAAGRGVRKAVKNVARG